ncbi:MAG: ATP-binding protein [Anaerolineales bacterium]
MHRSWPARFDHLDEIRTFVGQAAERAGLSSRAIYAVQMATDEACSNIIEHAYRGQAGEINIQVDWDGKALSITIQDTGRSFEMEKVSKPDIDAPLSKRKIGGLGVYLIHQLMDEVKYSSSERGNTLTLIKYGDKDA